MCFSFLETMSSYYFHTPKTDMLYNNKVAVNPCFSASKKKCNRLVPHVAASAGVLCRPIKESISNNTVVIHVKPMFVLLKFKLASFLAQKPAVCFLPQRVPHTAAHTCQGLFMCPSSPGRKCVNLTDKEMPVERAQDCDPLKGLCSGFWEWVAMRMEGGSTEGSVPQFFSGSDYSINEQHWKTFAQNSTHKHKLPSNHLNLAKQLCKNASQEKQIKWPMFNSPQSECTAQATTRRTAIFRPLLLPLSHFSGL